MARLICDRLSTRYGSDSVFMDVEKIQPGEDFRKHIAEALQECDVLIVIVGKKWLGQRKGGHTTINDESDWVRIEVETALERNIKIIPVLINRANMPRADQLPESLREFVYRSALRIDAGADFDDHMDRLIESIDHTLESVRNRPENPKAPAQTGKKIEHAFLPTFPKSTVEDAPATESAAGSSGPNMQEPLFQAGVLGGIERDTVAPQAESGEHHIDAILPATSDETKRPAQEPTAPPPKSKIAVSTRRNLSLAAAACAVILLLASSAVWQSWPVIGAQPPLTTGNISPPQVNPPNVSAPSASRPTSTANVDKPQKPAPPKLDSQRCAAALSGSMENQRVGGPLLKIIIEPDLARVARLRDVAISPDGTKFATAGDDGYVRLWDASNFKLIEAIPNKAAIYSLDFWSDGKKLAFAGWDGIVGIWDIAAKKVTLQRAEQDGKPIKQYGVAFAPDKKLTYVVSVGDNGLVWIWDAEPLASHSTAQAEQGKSDQKEAPTVRSLSFAPNTSGEFVTLDFDGKLKFFRERGKIETYDAVDGKGLRVAYSPDGTRVVSAGNDKHHNNLKIWDAKQRSSAQTLNGYGGYIESVAWSRDGKKLVSGGDWKDPTVRVWDLIKGGNIALPGHRADVEAVGFLPNSSDVVSVSEDKTMKVWDTVAKRELLTIVAFGKNDFLSYTPDGCYTGSDGIEKRMKVSYRDDSGLHAIPDDYKTKLFVREGFSAAALAAVH